MQSGVPAETEGWRLENRTCGADVCTHYRQGGGEVVPKNIVDWDDIGDVVEGRRDGSPTDFMSEESGVAARESYKLRWRSHALWMRR